MTSWQIARAAKCLPKTCKIALNIWASKEA